MIPHGTHSGFSYHKCRCDVCVSAKKLRDREYYLANAEKKKLQAKAYYEANKDKVAETTRKYREENAEAIRLKKAKYAKTNSARIVAKVSEWQKANPERVKEMQASYRNSHRTELRASSNARYANQMATNPEAVRKQRREYAKTPRGRAIYYSAQNRRRRGVPYTQESIEWIASIDWSTEICTYCSAPATEIDHILPITKGGDGSKDNLTPSCRSCNASKGNRYLADFLGFVEPERMLTYA